jgi:hypothetical protein
MSGKLEFQSASKQNLARFSLIKKYPFDNVLLKGLNADEIRNAYKERSVMFELKYKSEISKVRLDFSWLGFR